jgi:hypothetical protein
VPRASDPIELQSRRRPKWRGGAMFCAGSASALGFMASAVAAHAQTPAGREIVNVASVSFVVDGRSGVVDSNPARDRTGELIDVGAAPLREAPTPTADGERDRAVPFRLTNGGNGPERFALSVASPEPADSSPAPVCRRAAFDSDGDGVFGPCRQRLRPWIRARRRGGRFGHGFRALRRSRDRQRRSACRRDPERDGADRRRRTGGRAHRPGRERRGCGDRPLSGRRDRADGSGRRAGTA